MNKTYRRIGTSPADHSTFGGLIFFSDFNTNCPGNGYVKSSRIARRIISDQIFDRHCAQNIENRKHFFDTPK